MKKNKVYLLIAILISINSFGQGVSFNFQDINIAKDSAAVRNQLIFLDIYAAWCGPCKAMENSIFSLKEVGEKFNQNFINLKVDSDLPVGKSIALAYDVKEFPSYFFLDKEGEIVHKIIGFQSENKLLAEANKALRMKETFVSLKKSDLAYKNGKRDADFLYAYLKRKSFEQGAQPDILEEYLLHVQKNEIKTEKVLNLISNNVGLVTSTGFSILSESLDRFMTMTGDQQKAILKGISNAKRLTYKIAVENKDNELFEILIDAVHSTAYSRPTAFAEERQFRYDFAKQTRNFKHFKIIAQEEAGQIMRLEESDFQAQTEASIEEFKRRAQERGLSPSSPQYKITLQGLQNGAIKAASFQLNEFAWTYYQLTSEEEELRNALKWSAYAIKLQETAANWETYAFLLKKLNRKKDAKRAMKQAVKLAKKEGIDPKTLKEAYNRIK